MTNFSNLFWNETVGVSDISSVHHQEFFTVSTAVVYVIQVCRQPSSRIRMEHSDTARKLFRTVPLSIISNFLSTHNNGICHTGLLTAFEQDQNVPS